MGKLNHLKQMHSGSLWQKHKICPCLSFPCKLFTKPIRMGSATHGTSSLGTEQEEMMVLVLQKKPLSSIKHLSSLNPCHFGLFFCLVGFFF